MHLADLTSYLEADRRLVELYADPGAWARTAIVNVASSGKFSSDRTIAEYASEIWNARPCPIRIAWISSPASEERYHAPSAPLPESPPTRRFSSTSPDWSPPTTRGDRIPR